MKLIAFDLDGTLVDSRVDIAASANAALEAVGLPRRPEAEVASFVGRGARNLVARCVEPHHGKLEEALAAWHLHYGEHLLDTTRPYPGIVELLASLEGVHLAIATNKPGRYARAICDELFPGRFAKVIGGDEAPRKPDPSMLLGICSELGVAPHETIYVGDMDIDEATAAAAGARFVGVSWGFGIFDEGIRAATDAAALSRLLLPGR